MTHFNTKLLQCARSYEAGIHLILQYFCISLRSIRAICESVCCLDSTQLIVIWTPAIGWVHPLYSSSSQSAEQSAENSHMSDFGLRFFFFFFCPPRVKIHGGEGGTKTNPLIGLQLVTSLCSARGLFS